MEQIIHFLLDVAKILGLLLIIALFISIIKSLFD